MLQFAQQFRQQDYVIFDTPVGQSEPIAMNTKPNTVREQDWPSGVVILGFMTKTSFLACGLMNSSHEPFSLTDQLQKLKQWRIPMLHNKNMLCKLEYPDLEYYLLRRQAKTCCDTVALRVVHAPSCVSAMFVLEQPVRPPITMTVLIVKWSFDMHGQFTPHVFVQQQDEPLPSSTHQVLKMSIGPGALLQVMDNRIIRCTRAAPNGASLPKHGVLCPDFNTLCVKPKSLRAKNMSKYMTRLGLPVLPLQPCITLLNSGYIRLGDWLSLTRSKIRAIRDMPRTFAELFAEFNVSELTIVDLMHASGLFDPLGKLKLSIVMEHCGSRLSSVTLQELMNINSISHKDAQTIWTGATQFIKFVSAEDLARWCWPPAKIEVTKGSSHQDLLLSGEPKLKATKSKRGATM